MYEVTNADLLKRTKFRTEKYVIMPGIMSDDHRLHKFRLDLYIKLTQAFGYPTGDSILHRGGASDYGNLLIDTAQPDPPAMKTFNDGSVYERENAHLLDFEKAYIDNYKNFKRQEFEYYLRSDVQSINIPNDTSTGPMLFLKSASAKLALIKRFLKRSPYIIKALDKPLHKINLQEVFLLTSHFPVVTPVQRTRNDKAKIVHKGTTKVVDLSTLNLETIIKGLQNGKFELWSKERPTMSTKGIIMKEYRSSLLYLRCSSRTAMSKGFIGNALGQPVATSNASRFPNFKVKGYVDFRRTFRLVKFLGRHWFFSDFSGFDTKFPLEFDLAHYEILQEYFPLYYANLIYLQKTAQYMRWHDGKIILKADPFKVITPDILHLHHIGKQSGEFDTASDARDFSAVITQTVYNWSLEELLSKLSTPFTDETPFDQSLFKDGGDDFAQWVTDEEQSIWLKEIGKRMIVKEEIPARFLGNLFLKEGDTLRSVPDLASLVKTLFNPEDKSSNARKFLGSVYHTILSLYSLNPDFNECMQIVNETFKQHFGVELELIMRTNQSPYDALKDLALTQDEVIFIMDPRKIHYKELVIRDKVKNYFFSDSSEVDEDLRKFIIGA